MPGIERKRKAAEKAKQKAEKAKKDVANEDDEQPPLDEDEEDWGEWPYGYNSGFGDEGFGS